MPNNRRKLLWIILISIWVCIFIIGAAIIFVLINWNNSNSEEYSYNEQTSNLSDFSEPDYSFDENSSNNVSEPESTTSYDETQDMIQSCINESRNLWNSGKLREALVVLLDFNDTMQSSEISNEINSLTSRMIFSTSITDYNSDNKFIDGSYPNESGIRYKDIGIVLTDSITGTKQVIGAITMKYLPEWPIEDNDTTIIGYNNGKFLFSVSSGSGRSSTFIYDIHSNKPKTLKSSLTNLEVYNDIIIGNTITFSTSDDSTVYLYDWDGKVSSKFSTIGTYTVMNDELYYINIVARTSNAITYRIYKTPISGGSQDIVCNIELNPDNSSIYLEGRHIKWHSDGKDGSMNLQNPYDITR